MGVRGRDGARMKNGLGDVESPAALGLGVIHQTFSRLAEGHGGRRKENDVCGGTCICACLLRSARAEKQLPLYT